METTSATEDTAAIFYVGYHDTHRPTPIDDAFLNQAQQYGYDMFATPITTSHFHSRVLSLLSAFCASSSSSDAPLPLISPLTSADTTLLPGESISHLVAVSSPWIDLCSPDPLISSISRQVLNMEVAYASFCGFGNIIISGPKLHHDQGHGDGLVQYARAIQELLNIGIYMSLSILSPFAYDRGTDTDEIMGSLAPFARKEYTNGQDVELVMKKSNACESWDAWHMIRTVCKYNQRLSVALSLPRHLPPMHSQNRWHAEPVRLLSLQGSTFCSNKAGYPVLTKAHQALIFQFMRLRTAPWILLWDVGPIPGTEVPSASASAGEGSLGQSIPAGANAPDDSGSPTPAEAAARQPQAENRKQKDPTPHLSYIRYLQRNQPSRTTVERFGSGYQDYLQNPLQPLTDNLESITYEVFEKDPVKYDLYERAITAALRDWNATGKPGSGPESQIVVAVVGAGRGPLVTRALKASATANVKIELWAVEKNPNAYVLLQKHNEDDWAGQVRVVKSDMRSWKGPRRSPNHQSIEEIQLTSSSNLGMCIGYDGGTSASYGKVDILISELLGSFGDNELSPECLDGVQHVLNPTHGISIPASYTTYLTPIAAPRLHADIRTRSETDPAAPETPYVVFLHAYANLSNSSASEPIIRKGWEFSHPVSAATLAISRLRREGGLSGGGNGQISNGDGSNEHNARFTRLRFPCDSRGACDGLAGYFEATLWGDVELSIRPDQMGGKSPDMTSWFPIFFPLKRPLYFPDGSELEVSMWRQTDDRKVWYEWLIEAFAIRNGERIRLGSSELHSSQKHACLM